MARFETAVLGIVQGTTEFLPVSSTAHLMIFSWLLSWKDGGLGLAVWLHAGTLTAILVFFRKDWADLSRGLYRSLQNRSFANPEAKMGAGLLITVVPAAVCGFVFEDAVSGVLRQPLPVAGGLLIGSAAIFIADRSPGKTKRISDLSLRDCVFFGAAQSFALVPGVSRSGASITGGMFLGYTREDSAKFAFMMGVPAISAAIVRTAAKSGLSLHNAGEIALGVATAAVSGIVAIKFLMDISKRGSYTPFVIYRVAVAVALILWTV